MESGSPVRKTVRRKAVWGVRARLGAALLLASTTAACGELQREGQASSFLIVNSLEGASGAEPSEFGGTLRSDVLTIVEDVPTVFNDLGRVTMSLGLKDPGSATAPASPSQANFITVNRYHVDFIRADGRNMPGVDVPYGFDGAVTFTVGGGEATGGFDLVRHTMKQEAPLKALAFNGVIISTIAEVTFYGHDQTGREVSAMARISVSFGNFGDPD